MSTRRKGNRTRRKSQEWYEDQGYETGVVEQQHRYAQQRDLFDLFDIIACKGTEIIFVQVKTNSPAKQEPYKLWAMAHCNKFIKCHVWTWYDYKGPVIQKYLPDGEIETIDERK